MNLIRTRPTSVESNLSVRPAVAVEAKNIDFKVKGILTRIKTFMCNQFSRTFMKVGRLFGFAGKPLEGAGKSMRAFLNWQKMRPFFEAIGVTNEPNKNGSWEATIPDKGIHYKVQGKDCNISKADLECARKNACQFDNLAAVETLVVPDNTCTNPSDGKVKLRNEDTVDLGLELLKQGKKPLIINMAHPSGRGGKCFDHATPLQEESVIRRSNLLSALDYRRNEHLRTDIQQTKGKELIMRDENKEVNPEKPLERYTDSDIPRRGIRYTPGVVIWADKNINPIEYQKLDVVSAAAPNNRRIEDGTFDGVKEEAAGTVVEITKSIYELAIRNGNDCIVLGALGCGGFVPRNVSPAQQKEYREAIADAMMKVHQEYKMACKSRGIEVHYAVLAHDEEKDENYKVFDERILAQNRISI